MPSGLSPGGNNNYYYLGFYLGRIIICHLECHLGEINIYPLEKSPDVEKLPQLERCVKVAR
jgi:hypothetical protein